MYIIFSWTSLDKHRLKQKNKSSDIIILNKIFWSSPLAETWLLTLKYTDEHKFSHGTFWFFYNKQILIETCINLVFVKFLEERQFIILVKFFYTSHNYFL